MAKPTHMGAIALLALGIQVCGGCTPEKKNEQEPGLAIAATAWRIVLEASIIGSDRSVALTRRKAHQPLRFIARDKHGAITEQCPATAQMKNAFEASVLDIEVVDPMKSDADQQRAATTEGDRFTLRVYTTIKGEEEYEVKVVRGDDKVLYGKTRYSDFWFTIDPSSLNAFQYHCPE